MTPRLINKQKHLICQRTQQKTKFTQRELAAWIQTFRDKILNKRDSFVIDALHLQAKQPPLFSRVKEASLIWISL